MCLLLGGGWQKATGKIKKKKRLSKVGVQVLWSYETLSPQKTAPESQALRVIIESVQCSLSTELCGQQHFILQLVELG